MLRAYKSVSFTTATLDSQTKSNEHTKLKDSGRCLCCLPSNFVKTYEAASTVETDTFFSSTLTSYCIHPFTFDT